VHQRSGTTNASNRARSQPHDRHASLGCHATPRRWGMDMNDVIYLMQGSCAILPPLRNTQRHPRNRKYITYHIAVGGKPSHGHNYYVQKISWNLDVHFWDTRVDRRTYIQTHRHTDRNTLHPYRGRSKHACTHRR